MSADDEGARMQAHFEAIGKDEVRARLAKHRLAKRWIPLVVAWLAEKDQEERDSASRTKSDQSLMATASSRAATAAERQASAAESANRRATIALIIAAISMIISIIALLRHHQDPLVTAAPISAKLLHAGVAAGNRTDRARPPAPSH